MALQHVQAPSTASPGPHTNGCVIAAGKHCRAVGAAIHDATEVPDKGYGVYWAMVAMETFHAALGSLDDGPGSEGAVQGCRDHGAGCQGVQGKLHHVVLVSDELAGQFPVAGPVPAFDSSVV